MSTHPPLQCKHPVKALADHKAKMDAKYGPMPKTTKSVK